MILRSFHPLAIALACGLLLGGGGPVVSAAESPSRGILRFLDPSLTVGATVSVKGRIAADGRLIADDIELEQDDDEVQFEAAIEAIDVDARLIYVLGVPVRVRDKTAVFRDPDKLAASFEELEVGSWIKVEGEFDKEGRFKAEEIGIRPTPRSPRVKVAGRIAEIRPSAAGVAELQVGGLSVVVRDDTEFTGRNGRERQVFRGRVGVIDEDDIVFARDNRIGRYLAYTGEVRLRSESVQNLDVDRGVDDDEVTATVAGVLAFASQVGRFFAYATVVGAREFLLKSTEPLDEGGGEARLGEAYFQASLTRRIGLAVGRQAFNEEREWYYNNRNLDAVRVLAEFYPLFVEASVSRDLFDNTRNTYDREHRNVIVRLAYELPRDIDLEAYFIDRRDLTELNDSPRIFALRALGSPGRHVEFWGELSALGGSVCERVRLGDDGERFLTGRPCGRSLQPGEHLSRDSRGWGYDLGATFRPRVKMDPSFTASYAWGSGEGDDVRNLPLEQAAQTTARSYRQSGLQRNRWKYNGVVSFRYYGDVLDPELTNLGILTLAAGFRPSRAFSLDLIYHDYRQDRPSRSFHAFEIDGTPTGLSTDIGEELDVIVGFEPSRRLELRLTAGWFRPGKALKVDASNAAAMRLQLKFRF